MNERTETTTRAKQLGAAATELLFAIASLAAAVLVGAMTRPKYPDNGGD